MSYVNNLTGPLGILVQGEVYVDDIISPKLHTNVYKSMVHMCVFH